MDHNGHHMHDMETTTQHHHGDDHGTTDSHDHMDMDMDMSHDMMTMYFHTNIGSDYVFFKKWKPSTPGEMIWTCIIIFILAVSYEGLKYYREYLLRSWRITSYYISDAPNGTRTTAVNNGGIAGRDPHLDIRRRMLSVSHMLQTFLHMFQFLISYLLMLVFMTYNVYLCIAVLIGAGVGYFLFGWYKSTAVDITEHCH